MKYIVVDLEMNPIRKKDPARRITKSEIIEIGACMLDDDLNEVASFKTFVRPEYSDRVNGNITALTGITSSMVEDAPTFSEAIRLFSSWATSFKDEIAIYSWSDNDYRQVREEMLLKSYIPSEAEKIVLEREWTDFQNEFITKLHFERAISLKTALEISSVRVVGREHDALVDAKNTASLLKVFRDPDLFEEKLHEVRDVMEQDHLSTSLGSLFDLEGLLEAV